MLTVAVPTRDRFSRLQKFVKTLHETIKESNDIKLLIIHDAPTESVPVQMATEWMLENPKINSMVMKNKSSLAELWNYCVMYSNDDWVLICNDDVTFNKGWFEYLETQIKSGQFLMINLFHYGAMCIHKSLMLHVGWFDEGFRGGGFEDIDYQLRISEANLSSKVDRSHDFIKTEGGVEIGHFVNHHKYQYSGEKNWPGCNNQEYIMSKWGRRHLYWSYPSVRQLSEIDWHPRFTYEYEHKYKLKSKIPLIKPDGRPILI